jgi:ribonuclease P protein component
VVIYVKRHGGATRVGFASPRGIGGAVRRNRARRLLKEAWLEHAHDVREGLDIMIVARPEIAGARLAEVAADLRETLSKAGALG